MIFALQLLVVFAIGATVGIVGDACHVASGTTTYVDSAWPAIWLSPLWFPCMCGAGVCASALVGRALALPTVARSRKQAGCAILAMVFLYAFTATLRMQAPLVAVVMMSSLALLTWVVWDASARCLAFAVACAALATGSEALVARAGAYHYAPESNGLFGLAPWLPCLFFALSVVASGMWRSLFAK